MHRDPWPRPLCDRVGRQLGRIDVLAVLLDAEVQVRAGREAGRADVADHGLGLDVLADLLAVGELAEVHVGGLDPAVVLDHHQVAGAAGVAALGDHAAAAAHTGVPVGAA